MENQNTNVKRTLRAFYNKHLQKYVKMKEVFVGDPVLMKAVRAFEKQIEEIYRDIEEVEPGCLLSPGEPIIAMLREWFPAGCTVVLDKMEDPQALPVGTMGRVVHVDDIGTIHVKWDTGSGLGVTFGKDKCHRLYPVRRKDGMTIPIAEKYPSLSRIALRQELPDYDGESDVLPCGSAGTVAYVDENGAVLVRFDGVGTLIPLTPGNIKFCRIWDDKLPLPIIADNLLNFCEKNHYRQNPATIGYWQPDAFVDMTLIRLHSSDGIRRILIGLERFRSTLPTAERTKLDKIRHDIIMHWFWVDPLLRETKELIDQFCEREYQDSYGADFSDMNNIGLAYTEDEEGRRISVTLDLIELQLRTYLDGYLIETIQYTPDSLIDELEGCDFDALVALPYNIRTTGGKGDAS